MAAFNRLVLEDGYDAITSARLAAAANVGRSTFYEHFANVDEVLALNIGRLLSPFVASAMGPQMDAALVSTLQHFWDNRKVARAMFAGGGNTVIVRLLTEQFEAGLAARRSELCISSPVAPPKLAAAHLAAGTLALIAAWVNGKASASATQVAAALHASGYAAVCALSAEVRHSL